ncbi:30S ribosomal protein S17 [Entomospira nematocerorum]|uniref:Small ribosomal subunit protein uS17 n=2 Tax=Entomospira TaxID=2834378 RepID=A0A968GCG3_9SPIO|nr:MULTISPECIES: 30S ribosomal protein S17 [Entomospira]NIZ40245.1 30S ribosomal protein S17 [Entomospira entomophilus]NIZ47249.1 30S ribosomal protein S17 [Entomospira nematocera]WDI34209.1 30S ribosomal protein S17 [Entomospira nematocera]WDI35804.1 30S ribosomal protein S17 [Entomospira entomophilus]
MDSVVKKSNKKTLVGIVTSDKMDKTVVVAVEGRVLHPLYKKYITRVKKYKAHDAENQASLGDRVQIQECRPVSKDKRFRLISVLEKAR